ncbi:hypothetical protein ABKN59_004155 [Abortiporus biennis]
MDKSPIILGKSGRERVIGPIGQASQPALRSDNRQSITMVASICTAGYVSMLPTFIFPGKYILAQWIPHNHMQAIIQVSPNGYITNELALTWLMQFDEATQPANREEWCLVILDNCKNHITFVFLHYAITHRIEVFGYISHSSTILQGLDRTCFGTFKTLYQAAVWEFERCLDQNITKELFLELVVEPF